MNADTIANLKSRGQRLGIYCPDCGRFRYITASFPDTATLDILSKDMKCARCLSENAELKPVSRDARNGRWPAEGS